MKSIDRRTRVPRLPLGTIVGSRWALAASLIVALLIVASQSSLVAQEAGNVAEQERGAVEFTLTLRDGSVLNCRAGQPEVVFETRYGTVRVPLAELTSLQLAPRGDSFDDAQLAAMLELLETPFDRTDPLAEAEIERAMQELFLAATFAEKAVVELAAQGSEAGRYRAQQIVDRWKRENQILGGERRDDEPGYNDVLEANSDRFVGRLSELSIRIETDTFGVLEADVERIASLRLRTDEPRTDDWQLGQVLPDPGDLTSFVGRFNERLAFRVTGWNGGTIWGSDTYTTDSPLATTAVHAGVLKVGETGIVVVEIIEPPKGYAASNRNGVSSRSYGNYGGAYRFHRR